jgi:hypothetical protein
MSLVAWFDIPLALLAALCFVLAWQDARRSKRAHERWMNRRVAQAQRAKEDLGYLLKEPYDEAEGAYKAAVSELTEAETATGVEIKGGGVIAKRAEIAPRELFSVKDARRAGLWTHTHDQHFETAIKFGGGHTRWTLRRDPEAPLLAEDFGDAAPWTDADLEGRRGDA